MLRVVFRAMSQIPEFTLITRKRLQFRAVSRPLRFAYASSFSPDTKILLWTVALFSGMFHRQLLRGQGDLPRHRFDCPLGSLDSVPQFRRLKNYRQVLPHEGRGWPAAAQHHKRL